MSETTLSGVFGAALTPITKALDPDTNKVVQHAKWLLENGCDGVAILGTTGEANSFSIAQRLNLITEVTAQIPAQMQTRTTQ